MGVTNFIVLASLQTAFLDFLALYHVLVMVTCFACATFFHLPALCFGDAAVNDDSYGEIYQGDTKIHVLGEEVKSFTLKCTKFCEEKV